MRSLMTGVFSRSLTDGRRRGSTCSILSSRSRNPLVKLGEGGA